MKVWDLHCDTLNEMRYAQLDGKPLSFAENNLHIDLAKLKQGDYFLQCFAAFINLGDTAHDPLVTALEQIDIFYAVMAQYKDEISPVFCAADIEANYAAGKLSAMLTVEEGGCCKGNLAVLRQLYALGVRMMSLTWNHPNQIAHPNTAPTDAAHIWPCAPNEETGLTEAGFAFVAEMERLKMIADVSHLSDKGFWDMIACTTRPFVASHSNCRALSPHCRNLTDEMIAALANRGGIAGLNYCAGFVDCKENECDCENRVALLAKHAAHFKKVGGIDMIALGSDFDGIEKMCDMKHCGDLPMLERALRTEGFTETEMEAVFYRNAMRFFVENL
ncbi:MAG: dipeptidase [Faecalibacterium sp.]